MDKTIKVKIVTPNNILFDEQVPMVIIAGELGEFGVLPNHQLLIANLQAGMIKIPMDDNNIIKYFVDGGIAEVTGERVNIVTDFAIDANNLRPHDITEKIAILKTVMEQEIIISKLDNMRLAIARHESLLNCLICDSKL